MIGHWLGFVSPTPPELMKYMESIGGKPNLIPLESEVIYENGYFAWVEYMKQLPGRDSRPPFPMTLVVAKLNKFAVYNNLTKYIYWEGVINWESTLWESTLEDYIARREMKVKQQQRAIELAMQAAEKASQAQREATFKTLSHGHRYQLPGKGV